MRQAAAKRRLGDLTAASYRLPCEAMLLLVDLDGVVYRASEPVPGVADVLAARVAAGDDVVYVTNNSMHYRGEYVSRLAGHGAPVEADRVVTAARATALHIVEHETGVRRVLVLGAGGLEREMRDVGLDVVGSAHAATRMSQEGIDGWAAAEAPDAVVVGLDPQLTYLRLAVAADCVRAGARFICTNRDPIYPTERGLRPGAGSVVAAVEAATGVRPLSIGKPEPHLLVEAAAVVGADPRTAVMVGDGLATDIAAARAVGCRSVLMLTGVTPESDLEALAAGEGPTEVAADAAALALVLERLAAS
jgi:4-nitrophenyl phosphatase